MIKMQRRNLIGHPSLVLSAFIFVYLANMPADSAAMSLQHIIYVCGDSRHFDFDSIKAPAGYVERRERRDFAGDDIGRHLSVAVKYRVLAQDRVLGDDLEGLLSAAIILFENWREARPKLEGDRRRLSYPDWPLAYLYYLSSKDIPVVPDHVERRFSGGEYTPVGSISSKGLSRTVFPLAYARPITLAYARLNAGNGNEFNRVVGYLATEARRWSEIIGTGRYELRQLSISTTRGRSLGFEAEDLGRLYFHLGRLISRSRQDVTRDAGFEAAEALELALRYLRPDCNPLTHALASLELIDVRMAELARRKERDSRAPIEMPEDLVRRITGHLETIQRWRSPAFNRIASEVADGIQANLNSLCSTDAKAADPGEICSTDLTDFFNHQQKE